MPYAGFWRRFAAAIIDSIVLNILLSPLMGAISFNTVRFTQDNLEGMSEEYLLEMVMPMLAMASAAALIGFIIQIIYFALMESSKYQATLGKLALGLVVTDTEGNRITLGRAAGRNIGKILSGIILMLGYIMAGFTARKQALHDLMAGTLVLHKATASASQKGGTDSGTGLGSTGEYLAERYEDDRHRE